MSLRTAIVVAAMSPLLALGANARATEAPPPPETVPPATLQGELQFPRITGAGGVFAMPEGTDLPAADGHYRVLFDASDDAVVAAGHNRQLEAVARAVNLYALAKVPHDRLHVAVVVHGKATPMVLSDARYLARFDKPNPDAALVASLHAAGVEFFVCGQALSHRGYRSDEVRGEFTVTLSAMTKLVELQAAGYGLVP